MSLLLLSSVLPTAVTLYPAGPLHHLPFLHSLLLCTAVSYILLSYVSPGYGISRPLDLRHLGSLDPLHLTSSLRTTCYHPVSPQHSPTPCTRPSLLHSSVALGTYTPYSMYYLHSYTLSMLHHTPYHPTSYCSYSILRIPPHYVSPSCA